jgi:HK97 family phage major capsid protein
MTLDELIQVTASRTQDLAAAATRAEQNCDELRTLAAKERRSLASDKAYQEQLALADKLTREAQEFGAKLAEYRAAKAEDDEVLRLSSIRTPGAERPNYPQEEHRAMGTTTRSRDIYAAERDRAGERSFFSDLFNAERGDVNARQRITEFQSEQRSTTTSSFAGLVVPQYLVEQAALIARLGRPFANSVQSLQIPEHGLSLLVPRGTTGASAAVQSTENTAVSLTDEVWANVTLPVATIAGQAQPSRQSLERGAPGIDQLIYQDLIGAYFAALDVQALSGSGTSGQVLGTLGTAGISQASAFTAAATIATFYTKVAGQISAISTARGLPPDAIAMHPRRYAWLLAQVDSQGRPLVTPAPEQGPMNVMGVTGDAPTYGTSAGKFLGLDIVVDGNLPTSVGTGPEDQVIVYRSKDLLLYENGDGTPTELRFEQTLGSQLTVTLVAYGYAAFTAGRYPTAVGVIGGNAGTAGFGLVAPVF